MSKVKSVLMATVAATAAVGAGVGFSAWSAEGTSTPAPPAQVGEHQRTAPAGKMMMSASWAFRPESLGELSDRAPIAVVAEVTGVAAGPPLSDQSEADPDSALSTQRIALRTQDTVYGDAPVAFELFKTGSESLALEGDPPYKVGESYLMFIKQRKGPDGAVVSGEYLPVAPDGRLRIRDSRIVPVINGPVGQRVRGQRLAEVKRTAREARKGE